MTRFIRLIALLILVPMALTSCSRNQILATLGIATVAAAGTAGVYYARGDLEVSLDNDIDQVFRASVDTLEDRGYTVTENELTAIDGDIRANIPARGEVDEQTIRIRLNRTAENTTEISVRVNTFGNEEVSRSIMDDIQARLR